MSKGAWVPTPDDLDHFRQVQRLAYTCCETIHGELRAGISEREAAALMKTWLQDHGVDDWFHQPFAWFGSRTSFKGFDGLRHLGGFNLAFYPGKQRLEEGMPFILDCAPTLGAYTADVGYSGALGHNLLQERLMDDLLIHRRTILDLVVKLNPEDLANVQTRLAQMPELGEEVAAARFVADPTVPTGGVRAETGAGRLRYDPREVLERICNEVRREASA